MAFDASNPKHVKKAEKQAEVADAAIAQFLRTAMSSIEGRAFFLRLLEITQFFGNPHTGNALQTAYNCGLMEVGRQVLGVIQAHCPDQYITMIREREDGRRSSPSPSPSSNGRSGRDSTSPGRDVSEASGDYDPFANDGDEDSSARH